tara:strand:- start:888 stop:1070 length:183 start_codon:yes stop_codon:yes gene_type:complete
MVSGEQKASYEDLKPRLGSWSRSLTPTERAARPELVDEEVRQYGLEIGLNRSPHTKTHHS